MDTDDLFAVARILAELTRLKFNFKLTICGVNFSNTTDNNFSIYHWRLVLVSKLGKQLKKEANNRISYKLVVQQLNDYKKYCDAAWDDSIRRYKFTMQRGGTSDVQVKAFYNLNSDNAYSEIIKMVCSY